MVRTGLEIIDLSVFPFVLYNCEELDKLPKDAIYNIELITLLTTDVRQPQLCSPFLRNFHLSIEKEKLG